ncbi:MAG: PilZ domain-containing protein [Nitrospiraceae bacterium]
MSYRRSTVRLIIERDGQVHRHGKTTTCKVVDMSEEGVRVKAQSPVTVGEELQLDCWLVKDRWIRCTVQVKYVSSPYFGARITHISPEQQSHLREYIDELITTNFPTM